MATLKYNPEVPKAQLSAVLRRPPVTLEEVKQTVMTLIFTDRELKEQLAVKGGYYMNEVLGNPRFSNKDVDFALVNGADVMEVTMRIKDRTFLQLEKLFPDSHVQIRHINGHSYAIRIDDQSVSIQIQPNAVLLRAPEKRKIGVQTMGYKGSTLEVTCISINEQLAEKIDALNNRLSVVKRMNDIYDIYYLLNNGARFDIELIKRRLGEDVHNRKGVIRGILRGNIEENAEISAAWPEYSNELQTKAGRVVIPTELSQIRDFVKKVWDKHTAYPWSSRS